VRIGWHVLKEKRVERSGGRRMVTGKRRRGKRGRV
jgi:hypothetical protein